MHQPQKQILKYISLFSGGFGLDLGFEQASTEAYEFELSACVDIDPAARQTIRHNRPNITIIGNLEDEKGGDLSKLTTQLILQRSHLRRGEVALIAGGPPCQAWSILGKRQGFADPLGRGSLTLDFVRVVREAQPYAFLMENVEGLLTLNGGMAFEQILTSFREAGYPLLHTWKLNAVDFGAPQYRKRIFIVGFREIYPDAMLLREPPVTHRSRQDAANLVHPELGANLPFYRCVRDVLSNIPDGLQNNVPRVHGPRVSARYAQLPPGARDTVDHTDRLRWDEPSGTVLVGSSDGGARPFIHPEHPRHITVREAALLQGFPDEWIFSGNQTDQYRQVGNAVPPPLAAAVARHIAPVLCAILQRVATNSISQMHAVAPPAANTATPMAVIT